MGEELVDAVSGNTGIFKGAGTDAGMPTWENVSCNVLYASSILFFHLEPLSLPCIFSSKFVEMDSLKRGRSVMGGWVA